MGEADHDGDQQMVARARRKERQISSVAISPKLISPVDFVSTSCETCNLSDIRPIFGRYCKPWRGGKLK